MKQKTCGFMNNIVVVGGGASGWLTALYLKAVYQDKNITVIESSEIGILGAGEGATPHLISLLEFLNIPVYELILKCDATIKNGIKFTNWNDDGKHFYHSFIPKDNIGFDIVKINDKVLPIYSSVLSALYLEDSLEPVDFGAKISEDSKVPFFKNKDGQYEVLSNYSIHFNAVKFAGMLKEIAVSRGIHLVDGIVDNIVVDNNNNIKSLVLSNKKIVDVDFVFDNSGFHRVIIGKHFNAKWKSHSEYLPVDSAIPFFISQDKEIPPYTEAIAMRYGWMWKIPLQSRYGCGYVYDSSLISEKEAVKEIEEYLGFEPEYPRKEKGGFKFNAGYYETPWVNNCIAIGLASGFIEPLEATSIWVSIMSLERILSSSETLESYNQKNIDDFNSYFKSINDQVVDFIYFHYMSKRSDTDFWKKFKYDNAPENLKSLLNTWEYRLPRFDDFFGKIWILFNWISVAAGIKKINKEKVLEAQKKSIGQHYGFLQYEESVRRQNDMANACINHKEFIGKINASKN